MNCYDFAALVCEILMDTAVEEIGCAHLYEEAGIESDLPGFVVHSPDGDDYLVSVHHVPRGGVG